MGLTCLLVPFNNIMSIYIPWKIKTFAIQPAGYQRHTHTINETRYNLKLKATYSVRSGLMVDCKVCKGSYGSNLTISFAFTFRFTCMWSFYTFYFWCVSMALFAICKCTLEVFDLAILLRGFMVVSSLVFLAERCITSASWIYFVIISQHRFSFSVLV